VRYINGQKNVEKPIDDFRQATTTTPTAAIAPAPQDKVSGVLMDAGLSRWLLALGNSDVAARANVPPLRDHERAFRSQPPPQFNVLPLRAVEYAPPSRTSASTRRARLTPVTPAASLVRTPTSLRFAPSNARRQTQRPQQFQRPPASRIHAGTPAPPGRLPGAGGKQQAAQVASALQCALTHWFTNVMRVRPDRFVRAAAGRERASPAKTSQ
jgi:hypothetical protein